MTKLTLPSGDWLMVKVGSDKTIFRVRNLHSMLECKETEKQRYWDVQMLPPGNYSLYGADPLRLTEEESSELVEESHWSATGGSYLNYENGMFVFANSKSSLRSLIRANGYEVGECILLKVKK